MPNQDISEQSRKRIEADKMRIPKLLQENQHKLNFEIIQKQHSLNLEIHKKQSKLLVVSLTATIIATLLGALLGAMIKMG